MTTTETTFVPHTFGRWMAANPEFVNDIGVEQAEQYGTDTVIRWCEEHHLTPIFDTARGHVTHDLPTNRSIIIGEVRALGTDPAKRMPNGWRGWLRAALERD